jgi:hypothetical protein
MNEGKGIFDELFRRSAERREKYDSEVLKSLAFQDGLRRLEGLADDFVLAVGYARMMSNHLPARDNYMLTQFSGQLVESANAITQNAREGMQNPARRELRFMLEMAIKLSVRDNHHEMSLDDRLSALNDSAERFEDYVAQLAHFPEFENPEDANADALCLYKALSRFVHPTAPQFEDVMRREARGEPPGMESIGTLDRFNDLALQVYDLVLVRVFTAMGVSMAGDMFTGMFDDMPKWRYHKAKYIKRLSKCFDYKYERKKRAGLL